MGLLTFDACQVRQCVEVRIVEDGVCEEREFFTYHLTRTADLNPRIEFSPASGRIQIMPNIGSRFPLDNENAKQYL